MLTFCLSFSSRSHSVTSIVWIWPFFESPHKMRERKSATLKLIYLAPNWECNLVFDLYGIGCTAVIAFRCFLCWHFFPSMATPRCHLVWCDRLHFWFSPKVALFLAFSLSVDGVDCFQWICILWLWTRLSFTFFQRFACFGSGWSANDWPLCFCLICVVVLFWLIPYDRDPLQYCHYIFLIFTVPYPHIELYIIRVL